MASNQEVMDFLNGGSAPSSASPSTPSTKGVTISPQLQSYMDSLGRLETNSGVKNVGENNVYNLKSLSKTNSKRGFNKIENSNSNYRNFSSKADADQGLYKWLLNHAPDAINATTPEQFVDAIQKGGYATDPNYRQKYLNVHKSMAAKASNKQVMDFLDQGAPQTASAPDQQSTPEEDKGAFNTFWRSGVNTLTAGLSSPYIGKVTEEEKKKYPAANLTGEMAGLVPYAFVPGGIPVQMGLMAGRGGLQSYIETKGSADDKSKAALISGGIEGALTGVGGVVGKGVAKGVGYLGEKVVNPWRKQFYPGAEAGLEAATKLKATLDQPSFFSTKEIKQQGAQALEAAGYTKGEKVFSPSRLQATGKAGVDTLKEMWNPSTYTPTLIGAAGGYMAGDTPEEKLKYALGGAGLLTAGKAALAKSVATHFPNIMPGTYNKILKTFEDKAPEKVVSPELMEFSIRRLAKENSGKNINDLSSYAIMESFTKSLNDFNLLKPFSSKTVEKLSNVIHTPEKAVAKEVGNSYNEQNNKKQRSLTGQ